MKRLVVALFLLFGSLGLFLFYSSFYIQLIIGVALLLTAVWYVPMVVGGLAIGAVGGFALHLLPGQMLLFYFRPWESGVSTAVRYHATESELLGIRVPIDNLRNNRP